MSIFSKLCAVLYAVAVDAGHRQNVTDFLSFRSDPQLTALAEEHDRDAREAVTPAAVITLITALYQLVTNPQVAALFAQIFATIKSLLNPPTPAPAPPYPNPVSAVAVPDANPPG